MDQLIRLYRYLFSSSKFYRFNRFLFKLSLRGMGVLNYESRKISGEFFVIDKILPRFIKKDNPVLFDVGANVGDYTLALKKKFTGSTIFAFEPHPGNYTKLSNTKESYIKLYNVGLGEKSGNFFLYDVANADGTPKASLFEEALSLTENEETKKIEITITTLDEFTKLNKIDFIDFMKIDTEGNELSVLKGASNMLREKRIGFIQFEFNEMNTISRIFFRDFTNLLEDYEFYRLLPNSIIKLDNSPVYNEIFAFQNILAVPCRYDMIL